MDLRNIQGAVVAGIMVILVFLCAIIHKKNVRLQQENVKLRFKIKEIKNPTPDKNIIKLNKKLNNRDKRVLKVIRFDRRRRVRKI